MATPKPDPPLDPLVEYNMSHPMRGCFLIINQMNFDKKTRQSNRTGSDADADRLEKTFTRLGFTVVPFKNLKLSQLQVVLAEYSGKDHRSADCFALAMMSHGERDVIYCTDGPMPVDEVTRPFRADACPTLIGKPKLFFFQACRGALFDDGADRPKEVTDANVSDEELEPETVRRLPIEADNFFFYSTPPGYFSWKNSVYGSWFMQELCRALDQCGDKHEFGQLMVTVQREVASGKYESFTDKAATSKKKQMPVSVSQLTKLLYFRPKYVSSLTALLGTAAIKG